MFVDRNKGKYTVWSHATAPPSCNSLFPISPRFVTLIVLKIDLLFLSPAEFLNTEPKWKGGLVLGAEGLGDAIFDSLWGRERSSEDNHIMREAMREMGWGWGAGWNYIWGSWRKRIAQPRWISICINFHSPLGYTQTNTRTPVTNSSESIATMEYDTVMKQQ